MVLIYPVYSCPSPLIDHKSTSTMMQSQSQVIVRSVDGSGKSEQLRHDVCVADDRYSTTLCLVKKLRRLDTDRPFGGFLFILDHRVRMKRLLLDYPHTERSDVCFIRNVMLLIAQLYYTFALRKAST